MYLTVHRQEFGRENLVFVNIVVVSRDPSGACEGGDHSNGLASILQPPLELSFHGKHKESMHPVSSADDFIAR